MATVISVEELTEDLTVAEYVLLKEVCNLGDLEPPINRGAADHPCVPGTRNSSRIRATISLLKKGLLKWAQDGERVFPSSTGRAVREHAKCVLGIANL